MTFPTITKATQENYYHIQRIELDPTTSLYAHQLSLTPEEELQVKVTNLYSVAFSKGYACGEQQYIEEKEKLLKEKSSETIPDIKVIDFNDSSLYKLNMETQIFHLGYNCATRRLAESNYKNQPFNTLYSPFSKDHFHFNMPYLSEAYRDALGRFYFETDINSMNDLSVQAQMLQQLMYNDARTLQTVLNEEAYSALSRYTAATGLPMMMIEKFKPGMVVSTIQVLEFQKMGF